MIATRREQQLGFTLIEISIVLLIIGLIVGGIVVGGELIRAAEIRAAVSQLEFYATASNTFRLKYRGLPGDLLASRAGQLGMQARSGLDGHGDGDEILEGCLGGDSARSIGCENLLFWRDLSFASLIDDHFNTATDAFSDITPGNEPLYWPESHLGRGTFVLAFSHSGAGGMRCRFPHWYFQVLGVDGTNPGGWSTGVVSVLAIVPEDMLQMDTKLDDGLPASGRLFADSNAGVNQLCDNAIDSPNGCMYNGLYNVAVREPRCHMVYQWR